MIIQLSSVGHWLTKLTKEETDSLNAAFRVSQELAADERLSDQVRNDAADVAATIAELFEDFNESVRSDSPLADVTDYSPWVGSDEQLSNEDLPF